MTVNTQIIEEDSLEALNSELETLKCQLSKIGFSRIIFEENEIGH